jgi:hypothetical protein
MIAMRIVSMCNYSGGDVEAYQPAKGAKTLRVLEGIFTDSAIDRADFIRLLSELIATACLFLSRECIRSIKNIQLNEYRVK